MDRDPFVERLAFHYDQVNYVHPFREGNGRTQRVFWNRVARDAGWQVGWRTVHGPTNDAACRAASEWRDFGPLKQMFDRIVTQATPNAGRDDAWRAAELARLSFPTSATRAVESAPSASTSTPNAPRTTPGPRSGRTGPEQGR